MRRLMLVAAIIVLDLLVGTAAAANWHSQQRQVSTESLQEVTTTARIVTTTTSSTTTTSTTTTVAPTTTLPPVLHKAVSQAQRPAPATSGDSFDKLAMCESGMHNDTSGPYYGYFQFLPGTWHSVGESGMPYDYDYPHQKAAAQRLVARSGFSQFPACSRRLGLR